MRFFLTFVSLAVLGLSWAQSDSDYCKVCDNHTMCIYKGRNAKCGAPGPAITNAQKQEIVNKHNQLRQKIATKQETRGNPGPQPGASNMKNLVWNDELARIAQRWADQCTWGHDKCRNTQKYWWVGQNAYQSGSSRAGGAPQFSAAIQSWYDEVKDFNPANIKPFKSQSGPATGHYTQVAWADTTEVGCAYSNYKDGKWFWTMIICNYGPGGNVQGQTMYEKI